MTKLSKSQLAALKAAADNDGAMVRFGYAGRFNWCGKNHTVGSRDVIPDQKTTFGVRTINVLKSLGLLSVAEPLQDSAEITDKGREALKEHS